MNKLLREATRVLRASGLPYELVTATRHTEVFLCGERITVLSNGGRGRDCGVIEAAIRKVKARATAAAG